MSPPKCLVLGKNYSPLSVIPKLSMLDGDGPDGAVVKYLQEKCQVLYFHDRPVLSKNKPLKVNGEILYWPSVIIDYKQKMKDSVRLSREVLYAREGGRCFWCDDPIERPNLSTKDHVIPSSQGGKETFENLVCSCKPCNQEKADSMPVGKWSLRGRSPRKPTYYELLEKKKDNEIIIYDERWIEFLPNFASYKVIGRVDEPEPEEIFV